MSNSDEYIFYDLLFCCRNAYNNAQKLILLAHEDYQIMDLFCDEYFKNK